MFRRLSFGRAFERSIGVSISFISALIIFVVAKDTIGLTVPKIFSVMEIMGLLKMASLYMALGMGSYYETVTLFNRYAMILKI